MIDRITRWFATSRDVLMGAAHEFGAHRANRMAAAIAYRTVFALAPLLIIAVAVLGAIVGTEEAQTEILTTIEQVAGPEVAKFLGGFLESALNTGSTAALIGTALLFWSASSLFLEMQHDLNDIFDVPYEHVSGVVSLAKKRGIGFLWAFGLGLSMLAVWLLNIIWRFLDGLFPDNLAGVHQALGFVAPVISLLLLPFLFGLIFQTMTVVKVRWRAVWWGGLFTAVVFIVAAYGIGLYFTIFGEPTAIGFASSLVVVLYLAYLLSSVFLFGAEVTKVYSIRLDHVDGVVPGRSPPPGVLVSEPPAAVPATAIWAFLGGLLIGWRRTKR